MINVDDDGSVYSSYLEKCSSADNGWQYLLRILAFKTGAS